MQDHFALEVRQVFIELALQLELGCLPIEEGLATAETHRQAEEEPQDDDAGNVCVECVPVSH